MKTIVEFSNILLITPMIALFLFSLVPLTIKVLRGNKEQNPLAVLVQGLLGIFSAVGLLLVFGGSGKTAFHGVLLFDGVTQWLGIIATLSVGGALVLMYENPGTKGHQFSEMVFLSLNCALGMLILSSAVDLLVIFIGLEMMSLSLYLMIGMSHEEKLSKEAAFKYFILGSLASALFLYGVAFVFGSTGSTSILNFMEQAVRLTEQNRLFLFGILFILVGFLFKVSIAPFHAWTPDVYQGAATPHTSLMATAVKAASFAAFMRVIATRPFEGSLPLLDIFQWLAVITMIVGNVGAIMQNNFKRMLAYSSIAHSGYLLIGLITIGISENSVIGVSSVIFYLFGYCLMTFGAFAVLNMMERSENHIVNIDDLSGLYKRKPLLSLCLTVFLLSLAGLPPTLGFFGKFYLFSSAIAEGLIWLAIWGVLNSVISVYYYLRPIVVMYMRDGESDTATHSLDASLVTALVSAFFVVVLGVLSSPLLDVLENSLF